MPSDDLTHEQLFERLFRDHSREVSRYCHWRLAGDPDDAVEEVFLTAWRRIDGVHRCADQRVWLLATARRVTANHLRAARRRAGLLERLTRATAQPSPPPTPDADATKELVHSVLSRLPEHHRHVLLLAEWHELDAASIATVTGCSPGTARARLHRARKRFREAWEAALGAPEDHAVATASNTTYARRVEEPAPTTLRA